MMKAGRRSLLLMTAACLVALGAGGIEYIPTDSRVYDDLDLLKVSGYIRRMVPTSRPWTRAEAVRFTVEAESMAEARRPAVPLQAALERLEYEFGEELGRTRHHRPVVSVDVADMPGASGRGDLFTRIGAYQERVNDSLYWSVPYRARRSASLGAWIHNQPDDKFAFYDRAEVEFYHPFTGDTWDSSAVHYPETRASAFHDILLFKMEHAYMAFQAPWVRVEFGRDKLYWGPGYVSSAMLSDHAPALDQFQVCASFRNFKFIGFTSYLSRWNCAHRFLSAQRFEFSLWNRLTLGAAMTNVYTWDSLLFVPVAGFMNPLLPGYIEAANAHHGSNLLVGFDGAFYLPATKLYGQIVFDNFEFNTLQQAPNCVATQVGCRWVPNLPVDGLLEYARISAFTYYHRVHNTSYEQYQVPLGHRLGPDADQLYGRVRAMPLRWLKAGLWADYTRRGFYNRGDFRRKSFYLGESLPGEFPARGRDSLGNVIEGDVPDNTFRLGPELELSPLPLLRVTVDCAWWSSDNFNGAPGDARSGLEYALKVEYRY